MGCELWLKTAVNTNERVTEEEHRVRVEEGGDRLTLLNTGFE